MFKPRKNIRLSKKTEEVDDVDMEIEEESADQTKSAKKKKKEKKKKVKASGLSFADDDPSEENADFKIKKSSRSKKIAAKIRAEVEEERKESKTGSYWGSSTYTVGHLNDLKNSQNMMPNKTDETVLNADDLDVPTDANSAEERFRDRVLNGSSEIPDANKIHEARKKREEMRKLAQNPSYIPLKNERKVPKKGSRIDNIDSDDGDDEKITRLKVHNKVEQVDDDIDRGREMDDDSVRDWETNLIKGSAIPGSNAEHTSFSNTSQTDNRSVDVRIREKLSDIKERLSECRKNQNRLDSELSEEREENDDSAEIAERYTYFATMQSWLKDYTSFVNTKYKEIEQYVKDIRALKAEMASVLLRKRQLDVKDSGLQFTFTAPKGGNANLASDVRQRIREREARRTRRKLDRQKHGIRNHRIGDSSDEEFTNDDRDIFNEKQHKLEETRLELFEDVIEEYVNTRQVLNRFNQFRDQYHKWYKVCFIEECAGSVILPILKVDFGSWDPITSTVSLENIPCVENCLLYSCQHSQPELILVPYVISHYPLEIIIWTVEQIWDPVSSTQTKKLATLFNSDFWRSLPWAINSSRKMEGVLNALNDRFRRCIDEDVYIPLLPSSHVLDVKSDSGQFFLRQWNTALKIIRNIVSFDEIICTKVIQEYVIIKIINQHLIMKLNNLPKDSATLTRIAELVEILPHYWFDKLIDTTIPTLMPLARLVAKISQNEKFYNEGKLILKRLKAKEQLQLAKHNFPIDSILL